MKIFILTILALTICLNQAQKNYIVNGKFQRNSCSFNNPFCRFESSNYKNQIDAWRPDPSVQMGYGYLYSQQLGFVRVLNLDVAAQNSCIKQTLHNLPNGSYRVYVKYGARKDTVPSTSQFNVRFNGNLSKNVKPEDFGIHTISFNVNNNLKNGQDSEIKLCAAGFGDGLGAYIIQVKLIKNQFINQRTSN